MKPTNILQGGMWKPLLYAKNEELPNTKTTPVSKGTLMTQRANKREIFEGCKKLDLIKFLDVSDMEEPKLVSRNRQIYQMYMSDTTPTKRKESQKSREEFSTYGSSGQVQRTIHIPKISKVIGKPQSSCSFEAKNKLNRHIQEISPKRYTQRSFNPFSGAKHTRISTTYKQEVPNQTLEKVTPKLTRTAGGLNMREKSPMSRESPETQKRLSPENNLSLFKMLISDDLNKSGEIPGSSQIITASIKGQTPLQRNKKPSTHAFMNRLRTRFNTERKKRLLKKKEGIFNERVMESIQMDLLGQDNYSNSSKNLTPMRTRTRGNNQVFTRRLNENYTPNSNTKIGRSVILNNGSKLSFYLGGSQGQTISPTINQTDGDIINNYHNCSFYIGDVQPQIAHKYSQKSPSLSVISRSMQLNPWQKRGQTPNLNPQHSRHSKQRPFHKKYKKHTQNDSIDISSGPILDDYLLGIKCGEGNIINSTGTKRKKRGGDFKSLTLGSISGGGKAEDNMADMTEIISESDILTHTGPIPERELGRMKKKESIKVHIVAPVGNLNINEVCPEDAYACMDSYPNNEVENASDTEISFIWGGGSRKELGDLDSGEARNSQNISVVEQLEDFDYEYPGGIRKGNTGTRGGKNVTHKSNTKVSGKGPRFRRTYHKQSVGSSSRNEFSMKTTNITDSFGSVTLPSTNILNTKHNNLPKFNDFLLKQDSLLSTVSMGKQKGVQEQPPAENEKLMDVLRDNESFKIADKEMVNWGNNRNIIMVKNQQSNIPMSQLSLVRKKPLYQNKKVPGKVTRDPFSYQNLLDKFEKDSMKVIQQHYAHFRRSKTFAMTNLSNL